jgi:mono/diheme cytochrome c family protein
MNAWIKWTSGTVVALALAAMGAAVVGQQLAERKRQRVISVPVTAVPYADGAEALARGKYLYESRGCAECHGMNGAGRTFLNDGKGTHIAGPNITVAGVVARYQPVDWVRTIRHGIKPDGRPAMVMPSEDYNRFTDADLAALVAYVRNLAPVKGGGKAVVDLPLPAWVMYGFDVIPDAAQRINHSLAPAQPVAPGATLAQGAYVANMCLLMLVWPQNAMVRSSSLWMISSALVTPASPMAPRPYRKAAADVGAARAQGPGLEHVLAAADAAVHVHLDVLAHRLDDGGQRAMDEGAPSSWRPPWLLTMSASAPLFHRQARVFRRP